MKTTVVMVIVGAIVFSSLRSLINSFRGEGGCSCASKGNCKVKETCPSKK